MNIIRRYRKDTPVVILCGGLGTRLKEETEFVPKPMISIGGYPILYHIMKIYSNCGYKRFILCLGYKGDIIRNYFLNYRELVNDITIHEEIKICQRVHYHEDRSMDWVISLVNTGENSLTGTRIKKIENYIVGDTFMLTYGDGLADINIDDLVSFHESHGKIATVTGVKQPSKFGVLSVDKDTATQFNEKSLIDNHLISGGFFVFNRKLFDYLGDKDITLEEEPLRNLAKDGQLKVYKHEGNWVCMDNRRDLDALNKLWNEEKAFWWKD